jgi:hypothetical protein
VKPNFKDLEGAHVAEVNSAIEGRNHLKAVRATLAGGEVQATAEAARLALDFSDVTDTASLIACSLGLPPDLRSFVDAVVGLTAGGLDFVEITDEELADRIGKGPKTVQRYRDKFREWGDHAALVQIKDNYRNPETFESIPHRYKCNITALAVEAALQARLDAGYGSDLDGRRKAMEDAADSVVKTAPVYAPSKKKKRKTYTDTEMFYRELQSAVTSLSSALSRRTLVRNPDFDKVYKQIGELEAQLAAVKAAYGIQTVSTQNTLKDSVDIPPSSSDGFSCDSRMDSTENAGQVDNLTTRPESIEPTTYGKSPDSDRGGNEALPASELTYELDESVKGSPPRVTISDDGDIHAPKGTTDEEIQAAWAVYEEKKRSGRAWAAVENRFRPEGGTQPCK